MSGEHGFTEQQIANLSGIPLTKSARRAIARRRRVGAFLALLERDEWRCGLCFGQIYDVRCKWNEFTRPNRDHIWPRALWRPDDWWVLDDVNIRMTHAQCNSARGHEWDYDRDWAALLRNGMPQTRLPFLRSSR